MLWHDSFFWMSQNAKFWIVTKKFVVLFGTNLFFFFSNRIGENKTETQKKKNKNKKKKSISGIFWQIFCESWNSQKRPFNLVKIYSSLNAFFCPKLSPLTCCYSINQHKMKSILKEKFYIGNANLAEVAMRDRQIWCGPNSCHVTVATVNSCHITVATVNSRTIFNQNCSWRLVIWIWQDLTQLHQMDWVKFEVQKSDSKLFPQFRNILLHICRIMDNKKYRLR